MLVSLRVFLSPCMFVLPCLHVREHEDPIAWSTGCFVLSSDHSRIVLNRHRARCIHVGCLARERVLPVSVCLSSSHGSESQSRTPASSARYLKLKLKYPTSLDASNNAAARHDGYHVRTYMHLLALDII